jgi:hypothetical protein
MKEHVEFEDLPADWDERERDSRRRDQRELDV